MTDAPAWLALMQRKGNRPNGEILNNVKNAVTALRDGYGGMLAFDEMKAKIMLRALPGEAFDGMREITDTDETIIQINMQDKGFTTIGRQVLNQAIELVAKDDRYHSVVRWLYSLEWDGQPRTATWLARAFGSRQDKDYLKLAGQFFLLSMVARVIRPGCQVDTMLMLEGPQGISKSKACRILAGDWFSENLPSLHHEKDVSIHIAGKWLVEVSELHALPMHQLEKVKAFITRNTERYVPKYANHDLTQPRQCVFVGTTNSDQYLQDADNRRFWPVKCWRIDIEWLEANRDQLFAEIMHIWKELPRSGRERRWWPEEQDLPLFETEQEQRREISPMEDAIRDFFADPTRDHILQVNGDFIRFDIMQIVGRERWGLPQAREAAKIMKKLGWEGRRTNKGMAYFRVHGQNEQNQQDR